MYGHAGNYSALYLSAEISKHRQLALLSWITQRKFKWGSTISAYRVTRRESYINYILYVPQNVEIVPICPAIYAQRTSVYKRYKEQ